MKRLLAFTVAALVGLGAASVYAGEGCCAGMSKTSAKASGCGEKASACSDMFSKLNLTPDQQAKITALKEQTKRATSTSEERAMFSAGLEKILTPEQLTQFKAQCDASKTKAGGECPYMKSQQKS